MTAMTNTAKLLEVIVYKWSLTAIGKRDRDAAWCGRDGLPETGALYSHLILTAMHCGYICSSI